MEYKDIIGHDLIIKSLKKACENDKISHFYIFEGMDGLGKRSLAKSFAKTLLCEKKEVEACNMCNSCYKFDIATHPDFKEVYPEKDIIKKGQIDELIKFINSSPFESNKKLIIIDQAHLMNKEAQNGLLKSLEEPPKYIHIILISSDAKNLLPTIRSRGQTIRFYPIEVDKIKYYLVNNLQVKEELAIFLSRLSNGSLGKAILLSESEDFFNRRDWVLELIDALCNKEGFRIFSAVDYFYSNKDFTEEMLQILLLWFRDLAVYKATGDINFVINKDKEEFLLKQSFMDFERINDIIEKIEKTSLNIQMNVNFQLSIETMLLKIQGEV
ncbi:MAG: DNA polymerase III subunit delta' [Gudongella sp.]|nr:DNA polymerase III subunit delta' [Gudongella sp.]